MTVLCRQSFRLGNAYYGPVERPYSWENEDTGGWQVAYSYAYICPKCLEVWAAISVDVQPEPIMAGVPCRRHTAGDAIPGALCQSTYGIPWDAFLLATMPEPLLRRELQIHLDHYDGRQQQ